MGWNGDCFLVGSRLRSLGFRSIAMCWEQEWCMSFLGLSACLRFAGSQILLSAPFGSRSDKPAVTDPPSPDRKSVISDTPHSGCLPARLPTSYSALAEPSFSPHLLIGAMRPGPSSMILMDICLPIWEAREA